ncbi:hypothetical protein HBI21_248940 [Parastagonospora nodorum]|nr:hypothetical protein HBI21_248940 [Parastagonospora nodorum]
MRLTKDYPTLSTLSKTRTRLRYTLRLLEYRYAISIIRPGCTERIRLQSYSILIDIVKNLSSLVVILLTSSSKSLLFLALACLKDLGVLVVVLPFRELLNNIKKRLIAASILHLEYNSAQSSLTLIPVSLSYSYVTALLRA